MQGSAVSELSRRFNETIERDKNIIRRIQSKKEESLLNVET